jgi:formylglycine-generating enzyme required for sulfatase activity
MHDRLLLPCSLVPALTLFFCGPAGCEKHNLSGTVPSTPRRAIQKITTPSGATLVLVPAGRFAMGSTTGAEDERPVRTVAVSAFAMDATEVTQRSFTALMGTNPSQSKKPGQPVERVSWVVAVNYCNMRSLKEGLTPCYDPATLACDFSASGSRPPTEAEWEYACRAGTTTPYSFGRDPRKLAAHAWFNENAGRGPHPVGSRIPNPWGLYDMHGNVWEWCHDRYADRYPAAAQSDGVKSDDVRSDDADPRGPAAGAERVLRGGSWQSSAERCRSAARSSETPAFADACFGSETYGFRCVRLP